MFQALADPTRIQLVQLIAGGCPCGNDLNRALHMSQPRIARHLKILVEAGLVQADRDGRFVRYRLADSEWERRLVGLALESAVSPPIAASSQPESPVTVAAGSARERIASMELEADDEDRQDSSLEDFLL